MRIVQKYGGTSLADAGRLRNAARRAALLHAQGAEVILVVSACAAGPLQPDRQRNRAARKNAHLIERPPWRGPGTGRENPVSLQPR